MKKNIAIIVLSFTTLFFLFCSCSGRTIKITVKEFNQMRLEIRQMEAYYIAAENYLDEISETTDICSGSDIHADYEEARECASKYIDFNYLDSIK